MTPIVHHANHPSLHHDPAAAALAVATSEAEAAREAWKVTRNHERIWIVGRFVLAAVFLVLGADKLIHFKPYVSGLFDLNVGDPEVPLGAAMVLELVAGVGLALGLATRKVAAAIVVYLAGNTLMAWVYLPSLWAQVLTLVNAAVIGAMLLLVARGSGNLSVDGRRARENAGV